MGSRPRRLALALAFGLTGLTAFAGDCGRVEVAIGRRAPDFSLPDAHGRVHRLASYRGRVVVLEWIDPDCPFSRRHAEEGTMTRLLAAHSQVAWLAIHSTAKGRRPGLTPEQHRAFFREHGITYPVLHDREGKVGQAYGASTVPSLFVLDEEGRVLYRGAIDDDPYGRTPRRRNFVDAALAAHAAGKPADPATTAPYGCALEAAE